MATDENNQKDWDALAKASMAEERDDTADEEFIEESSEQVATETGVAGVLDHPSYKALEEKLTAAEQQAHDNWDKAMRAVSELENIRKRTERDIANAHKFSIEKFAKELLPIMDSLEQAIAIPAEDAGQAMLEGVDLTMKMFLSTLEKFNIKQLDPVGETFDPNLHEAMSMQEDPDAEPNSVIMVFQKGYLLHDRVIRPARVVVAKGGSKKIDEKV